MPGHDIIVIGASAGGVEALMQIARGLPADLPAAIFIVLHVPPNSPSLLPTILNRVCALHASHARDGETIEPGRIYVAPPDHHLLVKRGHVRVTRGPRENSSRPAVDPLFRTAAVAYDHRVVGVVLSGNLDDGTAGLAAIKTRDGVAVVQDPEDALYPGMPNSAMEHVPVDYVAPLAELPALLTRLAHESIPEEGVVPVSDDMEMEVDIAEMDPAAIESTVRPGEPAGFGCPDCGGALYRLSSGGLIHYRCRVGHAWSPDSLLAAQSEELEAALWTALRALEEQAALSGELAQRMAKRGSSQSAARFEEQASAARRNADFVRRVLEGNGPFSTSMSQSASETDADAIIDDASVGDERAGIATVGQVTRMSQRTSE